MLSVGPDVGTCDIVGFVVGMVDIIVGSEAHHNQTVVRYRNTTCSSSEAVSVFIFQLLINKQYTIS
jgi:hypothetical protein